MRRAIVTVSTVVIVFVALSSVGCNGKQAAKLKALTHNRNQLANQNNQLRDQLNKAHQDNAGLKSALDGKNTELAAARTKIGQLEGKIGSAQKLGKGKGWTQSIHGDKIGLGSDLLFRSGRASLSTKGKIKLSKIVKDLKGVYAGLPVRVYGYTDSDPIKVSRKSWQDNLDLSANRAMAVTRYLRSKGIRAGTVETVAMGATRFLARNNTAAGKARNRRVEIVVIKG